MAEHQSSNQLDLMDECREKLSERNAIAVSDLIDENEHRRCEIDRLLEALKASQTMIEFVARGVLGGVGGQAKQMFREHGELIYRSEKSRAKALRL